MPVTYRKSLETIRSLIVSGDYTTALDALTFLFRRACGEGDRDNPHVIRITPYLITAIVELRAA